MMTMARTAIAIFMKFLFAFFETVTSTGEVAESLVGSGQPHLGQTEASAVVSVPHSGQIFFCGVNS